MARGETVLVKGWGPKNNIRAHRARPGATGQRFDDFVQRKVHDPDLDHAQGCHKAGLAVNQRQDENQRVPNPPVTEPTNEAKNLLTLGGRDMRFRIPQTAISQSTIRLITKID